jgi:carboxyl-terminal processing protease
MAFVQGGIRMTRRLRWVAIGAFAALLLSGRLPSVLPVTSSEAATGVRVGFNAKDDAAPEQDGEPRLIVEVMRQVADHYLVPMDPVRLAFGAIEGMTAVVREGQVNAERQGNAVALRAADASVVLPLSRDDKTNQPGLVAAYEFIHRRAEAIPSRELTYGAIDGILAQLDAHSSFMPPDVYKEMRLETQGVFGGIGIQIAVKDRQLTVVTPIEGSPADRAGLQPGDRILGIDAVTARELTLAEAVNRLRGPPGTKVTLTVLREDSAGPFQVSLVRETITSKPIKTVELEHRIGYIRVLSFSEQSGRDLHQAVATMNERGVRGLILDLRGNRGGLFSESVRAAELFLSAGQEIVSTTSRHRTDATQYKTRHAGPFLKVPMIVLVDGSSASASEIVAAALQDLKRALVVGTKTYGKGSVQTIIPLSDGSALRLTTATYLTPRGRSIDGLGISPDLTVEDHETRRVAASTAVEDAAAGTRRVRSRVPRERPRKIAEEEGDPSVIIGRKDAIDLASDRPLAVAWRTLQSVRGSDPDSLLSVARTVAPQRGAVLGLPVQSAPAP